MADLLLQDLQAVGTELSANFHDLINTLTSLHDLLQTDAHQPDERDLIRQMLQSLICHEEQARCSFFAFDGESLTNVAGVHGQESINAQAFRNPTPCRRFLLGEGIIGRAAATRTLQRCTDCRNDEAFIGKDPNNLPGSLISVPVLVGSELLGVINLSHPRAQHFTHWHERMLSVYCAMLGLILQNHRLLRGMEQKVSSRARELETALQEANGLKQRYQTLSLMDELTQVGNRRYFTSHVNLALARALRYHEPLSLLLVDLDHFNRINSLYGPAGGEMALVAIAALLKRHVREVDILARMEGDAFVIAAVGTRGEDALIFARRLRQAISTMPVEIGAVMVNLTASIGVVALDAAPIKREGCTLELLIIEADRALYRAKQNGRNCIIFAGDP